MINVISKLFTNHFNLLPRYFNIADIVIVLLFLFLFIIYRLKNHESMKVKNILVFIFLFNIILLIGMLLNYEYFYYKAAFSQVIMYNEPIILFIILVNLPFSINDIISFKKILVLLLIIEFIFGILQFPLYLRTGDTEAILGTFYHNAEQYAAFLMIGIFYLIGKMKILNNKITNIFLIFSILILILFIDNKASWIGLGISIYYILYRIGKLELSWIYSIKSIIFISIILLVGYSIVVISSSTLYKYDNIVEAWNSDNFYNIGKLKAYKDIFSAYQNHNHMLLVGSGPATFYSRASRQYYYLSDDMFYNNPYASTGINNFKKDEDSYKPRESNSMAGIIERTGHKPFFKEFYSNNKIYLIYSGTVDEPYSSYAALLGESGILGTFLYLGIYIVVLKKLNLAIKKYQKDSFIFSLIVCSVGFLIYNMSISLYNNWLETGRMTTILWSMIAMVYKYDEVLSTKEVTIQVTIQQNN